MWTFLTNCPQSSTSAKGHRHLNKPRSSVAGVAYQTKHKSGLQEWGQLSKKKLYWEWTQGLGQHKNMRSSCPKLPCTDICSWNHCAWLQGWSQEAGCTVSAFKPSSMVGCFHGMLMVLCSILSVARKEKK